MELKEHQEFTAKDLTDEIIEQALTENFLFGADASDIDHLVINNPGEFFGMEQNGDVAGFPSASVEGDLIVLASVYGWGKEDQIYCKKVYIHTM